jgi:hypothetical protein
MVLEPPADGQPLKWPIVSRGKPRWDTDSAGALTWPVTAASYPVAMNITTSYDDKMAPTKMGSPSEWFEFFSLP